MNLLFTTFISDYYLEKIKKETEDLGFNFDYIDEREMEENFDASKYDILVGVTSINKINPNSLEKLKVFIVVTTGIDHLPEYIFQKNEVQISNNEGGYAIPIAEWILMSYLMGMKEFPKIQNNSNEKKWEIEFGIRECKDSKILFLGAGDIAKEASKRMKALNAQRIAYRRKNEEHPDFDKIIVEEDLNKELSSADCVVVCLPDTKKTQGFLDSEKLSLMRDDAILINISRGSVIDEKALVSEIEKGKFRFVSLDVFEKEPLPIDSPLWDNDRVFVSAHTSWVSESRDQRVYKYVLENLKSFKKNAKLLNLIDKENKY